MVRTIIALFLLFAAQQANAAECGSTANRAGCVGPTERQPTRKTPGWLTRTALPLEPVAPGVHVEGAHGNSATKAVAPGCAFC